MKRSRVVVAGILVVAIAGGAWLWKRHKAGDNGKRDWVKVTRGDLIVKYEEVGQLEPKVQVDVKSNVTGRITKLFVQEGDVVKKGQPLAVVQPGQTAAERYLPYEVRSPIAGTVIKRKVEIGDSVVSGLAEFGAGTVIATVGDLSKMVVKLDVNEVDVPKLSLHQKANVYLDAFPGQTFDGEILFISPLAELNDDKIKVFKTKVDVAKADPRLRPGMTARIEVELARKPAVLKAPLEAVFEEGGKKVAYVVADNPKQPPARRPIQLGLKDEVDAEVVTGLREGERLSLTKPEDKDHAQAS